ncbi:MAG: uroporphyrinogen-III C-methyltransferase [Oscillospiraceae bacterium]|nr:uroporphyrinogen-III C-methyltransferase [Oscillospiraceae bacterium]
MTGTVTLVGAGCGDFDLITLRGREALSGCDTVIYDSLIDMRLLEFCPDAEKICVGKRAGRHSAAQEEINALLVEKALSGRNVVRLKGGDPFVFGRGGEEILTLSERGIPFSIVPGVTSCVAVPELAGIPVTHRRSARSFHVITGHTADSCTPESLEKYAGIGGTLVFLMGLNSLDGIAHGLISGGMSGDTPAAVISQGATIRQRTVRAPLSEIAEKAGAAELPSPAVIVVGETAGFDFSPTYAPPLAGVSIAVISSPETGRKLAKALCRLGAYAFRAGGMDIRELHTEAIDKALSRLGEYTHIALTSPNGARIFLKKLRAKRIDLRSLTSAFAVVGKGTAAVLEQNGIFPELIPEEYNTAALGRLLCDRLGEADRLLIMRSADGSRELTPALDSAGITYDDVRIYEPESPGGAPVDSDLAVFTSAGAVRSFFGSGGSLGYGTAPVAIGKITAGELEKHGFTGCIIPEESSTDGIINTILGAVKCRDSDV